MSLIEWSDSFSVGVPAIDHEHQSLIALINLLYDDIKRGATGEEIDEFFGEIYASISSHFALEEKMMRDARYPEYEAHKAEHEQLLDDIRDIMEDSADAAAVDEDELSARLRSWFGEHFRTMDARLHNTLRPGPG